MSDLGSEREARDWPEANLGGPPPVLGPHEVHVFRLHLGHPGANEEDHLRRRLALLSAGERARAERRRIASKRAELILTRAALRRLLGWYLGLAPENLHRDLAFTQAEHGKPSLGQPAANGLEFNVSHSHAWALLAIARGFSIGVDVECERTGVDYPRVARRFFSEPEQVTLRSLPAEEHQRAFFRCWARKEAIIKAHGQGIGLGLDAFDVTLAPREAPRLAAIRWGQEDLGRWHLAEISVAPGYAAAVAGRVPRFTLRCASLCA